MEPHQPGDEVDVSPAQAAQLVLAQPVAGKQRQGHAVTELWLRLDDYLDPLQRVCPPAVRFRPARWPTGVIKSPVKLPGQKKK